MEGLTRSVEYCGTGLKENQEMKKKQGKVGEGRKEEEEKKEEEEEILLRKKKWKHLLI